MARKKKTEETEIIKAPEIPNGNFGPCMVGIVKPVDFGTGWTGKNNKIQYELYEVKKNE